ncbi:hypothetical protein IW261DRAFT_1559052 [Armillaria novae-zelandiae]|uniref:Uncharacterized protein n=1 Tax=Armillaria novae-zelandiae TaxID=153914 RepID=A0AA39TFF9_9AGAR|nr:hypothetical protein IW261DRAFT_1559052 [Armillaria novae-zelandiae]
MSSTNNPVPTLNSLVAWVDALMKSPPAADADFLAITAFFNEAATIKCSLLVYYSSSSCVNFYHDFEQFISGLVIQFHFTDQWLSVFHVETTRLWAAASGNYHLTGDQILGGLEVLPPIRYRIDEDILMSSAPFSPVLSATKSIPGSPKSTSGGSTAVTLKDASITPDRSGSPSPTSGSASPVSSADWTLPSSTDPAPFIKLFAETEGTLQDAVEIGDKITDMYRRTFNKSALRYGETFCAICSGTPSHPAHECPACSIKVIRPCSVCILEGTECIFAGLSTKCIACHKGLLRSCIGGVPDWQILIMPFNDLRPEDDEHVLNLVEDMIDLDPFSVRTPVGFPKDCHTEGIINNAKAYVGVNSQQLPFHGVESISTLVKAKDAYHQHLEANTHELYLFLKIRHIVVQQLQFVTAKLDDLHEQESAEVNTMVKMALSSKPAGSNGFPWWLMLGLASGKPN